MCVCKPDKNGVPYRYIFWVNKEKRAWLCVLWNFVIAYVCGWLCVAKTIFHFPYLYMYVIVCVFPVKPHLIIWKMLHINTTRLHIHVKWVIFGLNIHTLVINCNQLTYLYLISVSFGRIYATRRNATVHLCMYICIYILTSLYINKYICTCTVCSACIFTWPYTVFVCVWAIFVALCSQGT